jgi:hypothetical protein
MIFPREQLRYEVEGERNAVPRECGAYFTGGIQEAEQINKFCSLQLVESKKGEVYNDNEKHMGCYVQADGI